MIETIIADSEDLRNLVSRDDFVRSVMWFEGDYALPKATREAERL